MSEASTPALARAPASGGLADSVYDTARRRPGLVVFRQRAGAGWRDVTAARFRDDVLAVAKGLVASGIGPGERIGLMSRNRYEWAVLDYAIASVGAVSVPLYPTSSTEQAEWILRDSGAVACVAETAEHTATVDAAAFGSLAGGVPTLAHRWEIDSGGLASLRTAGDAVDASTVDGRRAAVEPEDPATIVYTSGTTGRPKGCVLTHANLMAEADNAVDLLHPIFRDVSRHPPSTLLFLPIAHVFGRVVQVASVRAEVCVGHAPSVRPDELLPDLASFRPTFLLAVPYVFEKVFHTARAAAEEAGRTAVFDRAVRVAAEYAEALERKANRRGSGPSPRLRAAYALYDRVVYRRVRAALGGRVRYAISGGAMLGRRLALFFAGAGILVYEGYGLTETTAAVTVNPPLEPRFGTVGRPMPGTTIRVDDDGEVLVRGPQVFRRYWGSDADATEDGWVRTGDIGELDSDGYLRITGRRKDLIVTSGGKNVAPGPLEDAVRADPLVSQCVVVGDDRPYVAALITLDEDAVARWRRHSAGDLYGAVQRAVDKANRTVSRAESIRRFLLLDKDFSEEDGTLTPSLKLRRQRIAEAYAAEIDDLYDSSPDVR